MCGQLDVPRNDRERRNVHRLKVLDMSPVGMCPDCRGTVILATAHETAAEAIRFHQSLHGGCDSRIAARLVAAHIKAGRPDAAVATMQYLPLKIEADDATAQQRHRLRDRITHGIPHFEETTWDLVYDLFGGPYESAAEDL